eukprot:c33312_g1_i1.p1 GENE.c33312_g1_i1~~c33312_g1_i1.p1  ORF type:complete len:405 (+),score=64.63 c33312_g1_i1:36-1250(+)
MAGRVLRWLPAAGASRSPRNIAFVLGNEGGDLDSIVSSIAYAHVLTVAYPHTDQVFVPLAQFPRNDFRLRKDAVWLFKLCEFDMDDKLAPKDMVFWDEIDLDSSHAESNLILVDHNQLSHAVTRCTKWRGKVVGILDHHTDLGSFTDTVTPRVVRQGVGSTCSLVVTESRRQCSDKPANELFSPTLATMLAAVIAIDTRNFDLTLNRFAAEDVEAATALGPLLPSDHSMEGLFAECHHQRHDVASFPTPDLLRLDYKQVTVGEYRVGLPGVLIPFTEWVQRNSLSSIVADIHEFASSNKLALVVCLTCAHEGKRQLMVITNPAIAPSSAQLENVRDFLLGVPATLSEELKRNDIMIQQGITQLGLGCDNVVIGDYLLCDLPDRVTRKAIIPSFVEFMQSVTSNL